LNTNKAVLTVINTN